MIQKQIQGFRIKIKKREPRRDFSMPAFSQEMTTTASQRACGKFQKNLLITKNVSDFKFHVHLKTITHFFHFSKEKNNDFEFFPFEIYPLLFSYNYLANIETISIR